MSNQVPALEPIKVLAMVLQSEMGLADGQIMLGLENFLIPPNTGLYVAIFYGVDQTIGNNNYNLENTQGEYEEVQDVIMLHQIDIDVMSFNSEARLRKQEVLQAVQSYYAETLMEQYQMRLASTPGAFIPIQTMETTKQLNRFKLTIEMNAIYRKTKLTPFYDSLQTVKLVENP